ncbi:MAG: phosphatase PAP2 family protein [Janthinobacterium lividum]
MNYLPSFSVLISGIITFILTIYPNLDCSFISLFHRKNQGFVYVDNMLVQLVYLSVPLLSKIFFILLVLIIIYEVLRRRNIKELIKSYLIYLLLTGIIGPGLIVNYFFKEHFGRARPSQILDFDGLKIFSRAFTLSDQCITNCSFSSGHAAMAFCFTNLAYVFILSRRNHSLTTLDKLNFNIVYLVCLVFGCLVSFSRILMGGHFLSDVTTSCFIVLTVNHLLYNYWKNLRD